MNFLADENVDRPIVEHLRKEGHAVFYMPETQPGTPDEDVLEKANKESALLLTSDKDFGELVFRQKLLTSGVILLRLSGLSLKLKADIVSAAVREHEPELRKNFTVVTTGSVRIRKQTM